MKFLSCVKLCDPMDGSPPGSSVHGIFQARILEWVAISFSKGSSLPIAGRLLPSEPPVNPIVWRPKEGVFFYRRIMEKWKVGGAV